MDMEKILNQILSKLDDLTKGQENTNNRLGLIESQVSENTQLIRSLIDSNEEHKAALDSVSMRLAHVEGDVAEIKADVKTIKHDLSRVEIATADNWKDIAKLKSSRI
jgi:chromosome segregation ATPase